VTHKTFSGDSALWAALEARAKREDRPMSRIVVQAVARYLQSADDQQPQESETV
jgi:hypothetical protein